MRNWLPEELGPGAALPPVPVCREAIELGLSQGRNAIAIWQDLVDASGFTAGYQKRPALRAQVRRKLIAGSPSRDRNRGIAKLNAWKSYRIDSK